MTEQTTTNMGIWKEIEIQIIIKILKSQWKHKEQFRCNLSRNRENYPKFPET